MGLNKVAIAGIMGNLMVESGFDPNSGNQREGAIGIAQWEGGRRTTLQGLAHSMGLTENNLKVQLEMLRRELNGRNLIGALNHAGNASNAAAIFDSKFEVSAGTTRTQRVNYANQYFKSGQITGSSGGGGGSLQGQNFDAVTGGSTRSTAADYKNAEPSLGGLLTAIPELKHLLDIAIKTDQPINDFINAINNSHWYRSHSQTVRNNLAMQFSDPATWAANNKLAFAHVGLLADQVGVRLSHAQQVYLTHQYQLGAWDDQLLQQHLGSFYKTAEKPTGLAAQYYQTLAQVYGDYGVPYNFATLQHRVQQLVAGNTTPDTYKQQAIATAKSIYSGIANQIDAGNSVRQIADPYIQTKANLLEVAPGSISFANDPSIKQALQGLTMPDGKVDRTQATPIWQFEQQVRTDPRWQYTNNAKDAMSTALVHIGSDFGFGPQG